MSAVDRISHALGYDPAAVFRRVEDANRKVHEIKTKAAAKLSDLASLRAQFYGGETSNFNHERKMFLAELMEARRAELMDAGETRIVETALERYAYAHPTYKSWLQLQQERRERMYRLEAELAQLEADAEAATGERRLAEQRVRLSEEAVRWSRAEMGLQS